MKTLLFNPFQKYSDNRLLAVGLITTIAGIFGASMTHTHYDGVLDTHFSDNIPLQTALLESVFNALSLAMVFFILGKIINPKTRFIDILNIALIVKIPAYLLMFFNINGQVFELTRKILSTENTAEALNFTPVNTVFLTVFTTVTIFIFLWIIVLLYNGFKVAVHTKNTFVHILAFVVGVVLAEVLSKVLIYNFI